ncbi:MAG TPA: N4-gp56 family major capsid protein [Candidatus Avimonoglobus intestinipullorum]|uniref:N4-gp56 family major capsid protein n=1 Tax=Candidatus Avimonoglobus intestinipullorum TaxID=2840699 RepID=A0A9D1LVI5_9FIRM|nr:N4-gp56 family major capsid protein [Candidatus Avimonoglobus intestinipullorum]
MTEQEQLLNMNTTTSPGTAPLFQEVLNRHVLMRAKPNLVHHQFGQKVKVPKGKTKTISFDKMSPLPKAKTPLTEGVTPKGNSVNITRVTGTPKQYGAYVTFTDEFDFYAHDPSPEVLNRNELLADNAAETFDSLVADVLATGTNVQYAGGKNSRATLDAADILTVDEIRKAKRTLEKNKAKPIDGKDFVAIVDPDVAFDLQSDEKWENPKVYADPKDLYSGEIGRLYGVRFVKTTEAKVFYSDAFDEAETKTELLVLKVEGQKVYLQDTLTETEASALASKKIYAAGRVFTITSATQGENGAAYLTLTESDLTGIGADTVIRPANGDANGNPVHAVLVIGKDAYGVTDPKSNVEIIIQALGSGGTADPLKQRGTHGWKGHNFAKILCDEYMVRIECTATGTNVSA